jgi:1-acyl-sn-glycerol-3-phosphate acyltransferase
VAAQLAGLSGRRPQDLTSDIDLDRDLGLGSLDRVELVVRLEQALGRSLDETALAGARTLADLESAARLAPAAPVPMPRWARRPPVRAVRGVARPLLVRPAFRLYCRLERGGLEHLAGLVPPFLMVANHASQLDTAAVVLALPHRLRGRLAVAMATEQFPAVFGAGIPVGRAAALGQWVGYHALVTLFHAYPLPRAGGFSATLAYTAELAEAGYCPLVFPEGRLVKAGEHVPFREGQARVAVALGLPTLPIGISGTGECMPPESRWPRQRVTVAVHFGAPVDPGSDPAALAARLEARVRELEESARRARG